MSDHKEKDVAVQVLEEELSAVRSPIGGYAHNDVESLSNLDYSEKVFAQDAVLGKGLKQRHIQMLALVGVFGTGLFLSSGGILYLVGNVGIVVAYVFVGAIVGLNQMANAEVCTLMPVTGYNIRQAEHFFDKSLGFALGWIAVYGALIPSELAATALVMTYWSDVNPAVWITVFGIAMILTNIYTVRVYGEIEFAFGVLKVLLIVGIVLCGLILNLGGVKGQERIGFRYWKETPWNEYFATGDLGRFLAFWRCVTGVVFSFGGVQSIAMFGGETQFPRTSIYTAAKRIVVRTFTLYFLAVMILSMILPSNDPTIANSTGNAAGSPFVIAFERAGIKAVPHIINAVVLTSAFSAANLSMISGSRFLFALAAKKQAPKIFLRTNRHGVPYVGLILVSLFIPLAYMSISSSSATVFGWFQSLTASNLLVTWMSISFNHIMMTRAMKVQGISRDRLPFKIRGAPIAAWVSGVLSFVIFITAGFANFLHGNWSISSFFSNYFTLPVFVVLYILWKVVKKTKIIRPEDVDLETLFRDVELNPEPPVARLRGWRIVTFLWA